jgi:hypothetical protein
MVIGTWIFFKTLRFLARLFRSQLRLINGPPPISVVFGSMKLLIGGRGYEYLSKWREQYGHVFVIWSAFGVSFAFVSLLPLLT